MPRIHISICVYIYSKLFGIHYLKALIHFKCILLTFNLCLMTRSKAKKRWAQCRPLWFCDVSEQFGTHYKSKSDRKPETIVQHSDIPAHSCVMLMTWTTAVLKLVPHQELSIYYENHKSIMSMATRIPLWRTMTHQSSEACSYSSPYYTLFSEI